MAKYVCGGSELTVKVVSQKYSIYAHGMLLHGPDHRPDFASLVNDPGLVKVYDYARYNGQLRYLFVKVEGDLHNMSVRFDDGLPYLVLCSTPSFCARMYIGSFHERYGEAFVQDYYFFVVKQGAVYGLPRDAYRRPATGYFGGTPAARVARTASEPVPPTPKFKPAKASPTPRFKPAKGSPSALQKCRQAHCARLVRTRGQTKCWEHR